MSISTPQQEPTVTGPATGTNVLDRAEAEFVDSRSARVATAPRSAYDIAFPFPIIEPTEPH